ncbi:MAG: class I SAM-dependent methyltransferase [Pseudomonadota bacterium]|nr:MAG: class I SAM-dependent methyltransferase [Pseudomonadota bacterium]
MSQPKTAPKFDRYARDYTALHEESVRASGETSDYFADYKLGCLLRLALPKNRPILDYGCGIGMLTARLATAFDDVHAYDPSGESLSIARAATPNATFWDDAASIPEGHFGMVVLACVLHHVPPDERVGLLSSIRAKLAPGGRLVIFEHNPWNPLTRRAVAACPFDDDAVLLWPRELRSLLKTVGYARVRQDYIVFFPRPLAALRPLEPLLKHVFLGAQTMTVGERSP